MSTSKTLSCRYKNYTSGIIKAQIYFYRHSLNTNIAVITKTYSANFSEVFWNVSGSSGDDSLIYVIPSSDFRLEITHEGLENAGNGNVG